MKYTDKIVALGNKFEDKLYKLGQAQFSVQPFQIMNVLKAANFFSDAINADVGSMLDKVKIAQGVPVEIVIVTSQGPRVDYKVTVKSDDAATGAKQAEILRKMLLQKYGQSMATTLKKNPETSKVSDEVNTGWFTF